MGIGVDVDGPALVGERAAIAGLARHGSVSCGGASHLLRTIDGWVAVSLARVSDLELVEAWLEEPCDVAAATPGVPVTSAAWASIAEIVQRRRAMALVDQATLLGLPCAMPGETSTGRPLVAVAAHRPAEHRKRSLGDLTVVDLSALWAGPLCANLLGLAGANVIKVESSTRPDGARLGPTAFFDVLHAGHRSVVLDLATPAGHQWLRRLLTTADVVIEASRPRALHAMGASFEAMDAQGWRGIWLSITGHGREGSDGNRVGFGDDAAVAGGLVALHAGAPLFCADAVADPITGLLGAAAVLSAVEAGTTGMLSISLARTAAHLAAGVRRHPAIHSVPTDVVVAAPRSRPTAGRAATAGHHTDEILATL